VGAGAVLPTAIPATVVPVRHPGEPTVALLGAHFAARRSHCCDSSVVVALIR
jgi:hypothetical protein